MQKNSLTSPSLRLSAICRISSASKRRIILPTFDHAHSVTDQRKCETRSTHGGEWDQSTSYYGNMTSSLTESRQKFFFSTGNLKLKTSTNGHRFDFSFTGMDKLVSAVNFCVCDKINQWWVTRILPLAFTETGWHIISQRTFEWSLEVLYFLNRIVQKTRIEIVWCRNDYNRQHC